MNREARIILPATPALESAHATLRAALVAAFGGCTRTPGSLGDWVDVAGRLHAEPVTLYDVAIPWDILTRWNSAHVLRALAASLARDTGEQAIYLRLPSGAVEFVEGGTL